MRSLARRLIYLNFHLAIASCVIGSAYRLYDIATNWGYYQHQWEWIPKLQVAVIGRPLFLGLFSIVFWVMIFIMKHPNAATGPAVLGCAMLFVSCICAPVLVLVGNSLYDSEVFQFRWWPVYYGASLFLFAVVHDDWQPRS